MERGVNPGPCVMPGTNRLGPVMGRELCRSFERCTLTVHLQPGLPYQVFKQPGCSKYRHPGASVPLFK